MGVSHQLVSNGHFSLLLSVAWGQDMEPQGWTHSVFADSGKQFLNGIFAEKWKFLFNDGIHTFTSRPGDLVDSLSHIHSQLRSDFADAFRYAGCSRTAPAVIFSPQQLQNLHGQRELLVDIIFQEKSQPVFL